MFIKYRYKHFSSNSYANEPLKKIPSTEAKAIKRSANVAFFGSIHFIAQSAFLRTQGNVSIALKRKSLSEVVTMLCYIDAMMMIFSILLYIYTRINNIMYTILKM